MCAKEGAEILFYIPAVGSYMKTLYVLVKPENGMGENQIFCALYVKVDQIYRIQRFENLIQGDSLYGDHFSSAVPGLEVPMPAN